MSLAHHGDDEDMKKHLDEMLRRFCQQGEGRAPREYPDGRMGANDEGSLVYTVGVDARHGTVVVDFNKPVKWLGLGPQDAVALAQALLKHARTVSKEPLTLRLT